MYIYIAYKQAFKIILIPPLLVIVRESNGKHIFQCVLNLLNAMTLRNVKVQHEKFKSFKTNI